MLHGVPFCENGRYSDAGTLIRALLSNMSDECLRASDRMLWRSRIHEE